MPRYGFLTKRQRLNFSGAIALFLISCAPKTQPPPKPAALRLQPTNLVFAGDVMLSRGVRREILSQNDPALPFRKIASVLAAANITFVNLESPFSDQGRYYEEGLIFHAAPSTIAGLELAGVDVVSTANNHTRDCGSHGVEFTVNWLRSHGMLPVGSSESPEKTHSGVTVERNGVRFGFLAYTFDQQNGNWHDIDERVAMADTAVAADDISKLTKRCDVVVVSMHSGFEYVTLPNRKQVEFAHAAIDAGAALVIGHHPHVIQPHEQYRGQDIFYSLGNFVFDQYQREVTQHGEVVEATFVGKNLLATQVWKVRITPTGPEFE